VRKGCRNFVLDPLKHELVLENKFSCRFTLDAHEIFFEFQTNIGLYGHLTEWFLT
jgi:hypothetical protein